MTYRTSLAVAGTAALLALIPSAAHAARVPVNEGDDYQRCVTYTEYQAVDFGMSRGQVRRIFDTDGRRTSRAVMDALAGQVSVGPHDEVARPEHLMDRNYPVCVDDLNPQGGNVYVEYNTRTDHVTSFAWI